jgi:hypothetical protein
MPGSGKIITDTRGNVFEFLAGTFPETITVYISPTTPLTPLARAGAQGLYFTIEARNSVGAPVQPLRPYTVTIGYAEADVAGKVESSLGLYFWNGGAWEREPSSVVNTLGNKIIARLNRMSLWGVSGDPFMQAFLPMTQR